MKRCRHYAPYIHDWDPIGGHARITRSCCYCNESLPLGPSNDSSEAVGIEMRAAELATRRGFGSFSNCGAGCERCGFVVHKHGSTAPPHARCNERQFQSGHLAHAIASHDDEMRGE